jgi:hypothetical protein
MTTHDFLPMQTEEFMRVTLEIEQGSQGLLYAASDRGAAGSRGTGAACAAVPPEAGRQRRETGSGAARGGGPAPQSRKRLPVAELRCLERQAEPERANRQEAFTGVVTAGRCCRGKVRIRRDSYAGVTYDERCRPRRVPLQSQPACTSILCRPCIASSRKAPLENRRQD